MAIAREAEPVGSLSEVKDAGLDREDLLGMYRNMLITRGVEERGHILYKQGKIPGSFYTGRGNEAASVGIGTAMAPGRRRHAAPPGHGRPHRPRRRALADLRQLHGARRRTDARPRRKRAPRGCAPRADCDGQPPARDAAGRDRRRARVPHPRRAARRPRMVRRRRLGPRRHARVDELRGHSAAADRLRLRQQPVGVLDADASRVRGRAPRRPRPGLRLRRASSSTAPTCSPSTARRSAQSRRRATAAARRCWSA